MGRGSAAVRVAIDGRRRRVCALLNDRGRAAPLTVHPWARNDQNIMSDPTKTPAPPSQRPETSRPPQIDTGYYYMIDLAGKRVGEAVVREDPMTQVVYYEHWITYGKGDNVTTAAYVRPSSTSTTVTVKFVYQGPSANLQSVWDTADTNGNEPAYESSVITRVNARPANI